MEEYKPQARKTVNFFLKFSSFKTFNSKSFVHFFAGKEKPCSYFSEENLKENLQPIEPVKYRLKTSNYCNKKYFLHDIFYFFKICSSTSYFLPGGRVVRYILHLFLNYILLQPRHQQENRSIDQSAFLYKCVRVSCRIFPKSSFHKTLHLPFLLLHVCQCPGDRLMIYLPRKGT